VQEFGALPALLALLSPLLLRRMDRSHSSLQVAMVWMICCSEAQVVDRISNTVDHLCTLEMGVADGETSK
jgi:hypothetical protein